MQISKILSERIINIRQLKSLNLLRKVKAEPCVGDVFESSKGILGIRNVRAGDYGTICDGSKPLASFVEMYNKSANKEIAKFGLSTNTDGAAPAFLKTIASKPISTSKVHDCSVAYFYNEQTGTHFLFHIYPNVDNRLIEKQIKAFMPEGFQKAIIVPGDNAWTKVHQKSLPNIFKVIKSINPETSLEVFHNTSRLPEIVGFNGSVYEIINTQHVLHWHFGQASFHISDVRDFNTLDRIDAAKGKVALNNLRSKFEQMDFDIEVKKILYKLIDEKINKLKPET